MPHVVLLGDSIFDNAAYVGGGPDVVTQLRRLLPDGAAATLCAADGAGIADVERQLPCVPSDATHLVLSVGGNDALAFVDVLERPAVSVAEVLDLLAGMAEPFEHRYQDLVGRLLGLGIPLVLCTVYNGWLPDPGLRRRARTALMVFNDAILRTATANGLPFIDLRQICAEPTDYANPIEPSVQGGARIARAIHDTLLGQHSR